MRHRVRSDHGFSLMELMLVALIMGILVSIAMASYAASTVHARRIVCLANQRVFEDAIPLYQSETFRKPTRLEDLRPFVKYYDKSSRCVSDGRSLVFDPVNLDVSCTFPGH